MGLLAARRNNPSQEHGVYWRRWGGGKDAHKVQELQPELSGLFHYAIPAHKASPGGGTPQVQPAQPPRFLQ